MRSILHILSGPTDELAQQLIEQHRALPQTRVEVVELIDEQADYARLVEKIFSADSIQVW